MMTDDVGDTGHRLTRRTVQAQTEAPKKGCSGFHGSGALPGSPRHLQGIPFWVIFGG